eukprot:s8783_g2.t1
MAGRPLYAMSQRREQSFRMTAIVHCELQSSCSCTASAIAGSKGVSSNCVARTCVETAEKVSAQPTFSCRACAPFVCAGLRRSTADRKERVSQAQDLARPHGSV